MENYEMMTLTASAQKAINRFVKGSDTPVEGLRISVAGGGCSGMQYAMDFVDSMQGSGFKFENPNASASCGRGNSFTA